MSSVSRDTVVVGRTSPDLTLAQFTAILEAGRSPALVEAAACHSAVIVVGVSPAFALAIFHQESGFGATGLAKVNMNPGNTRSTTTGIGFEVTTVKGKFIRYPNWKSGFRDMAWRLVKPDYYYALEGRRTIKEIIYRWAPPEDGNDPEVYINSVVQNMNSWIQATATVVVATAAEGGGTKSMATQLPPITWTPAPPGNFERGPTKKERVIIHDMEATYSGGNAWLDNPQSHVSAHYSVNETGTAIDQSVKEEDVAYHCGNYPYNLSSIGVEHAGWKDQNRTGYAGYQDAMYRTSAALVAQICKRNGIVPSRSTIIGHAEVPPPNDHTDPGPGWNWTLYMSYVLKEFNGMSPTYDPIMDYYNANGGETAFGKPMGGQYGTSGSVERDFERAHMVLDQATGKVAAEPVLRLNGHIVAHGMLDYWNRVNVPGIQHPLGLPLSEEQDWTDPSGKHFVIQVFERAVLGYDGSIADPAYRVQGLITGPEWARAHLKPAAA